MWGQINRNGDIEENRDENSLGCNFSKKEKTRLQTLYKYSNSFSTPQNSNSRV